MSNMHATSLKQVPLIIFAFMVLFSVGLGKIIAWYWITDTPATQILLDSITQLYFAIPMPTVLGTFHRETYPPLDS